MFEKQFVVIAVSIPALVLCRPEPPSGRYGAPAAPPADFLPEVESARQFAPFSAAQKEYGPPPPAQYGPPQAEYGPPQPEYGPPAAPQKIVTKNVYVHIPPPEPLDYQPRQVLEVPIPKKHYKIIFIKAPTAPTPTVPVIPEPVPDEHKTLVYVLVKKPEPQPQIEIPKVRPTEPSKPEVFFIKYKEGVEKVAPAYGAPPQ